MILHALLEGNVATWPLTVFVFMSAAWFIFVVKDLY